jgi:hypothetical protein
LLYINNDNDSSLYTYEINKVDIDDEEYNINNDENVEATETSEYVLATEDDYNDPSSNIDEDGYLLDENNERIKLYIIENNDVSTNITIEDSSIFNSSIITEEKTCELFGIQSENCPLKGIKYEFKIINSEIKSNSSEVLTCYLRFWNDSDTFGFLDFSFKFPKFRFDVDDNNEITGNEMDAYTIEGSTTLSSLLNKIIIKGVEVDDNEVLFNTTSFKTTIKKVLNSSISNSMPSYDPTANNQPSSYEETVTINESGYITGEDEQGNNIIDDPEIIVKPEDENVSEDPSTRLLDPSKLVTITDNENDIISSEQYGVMNIGKHNEHDNEQNEVITEPKYFAVLNRNTGEIIGVGNESEINYDEYGRFIISYLDIDPSTGKPTNKTKPAGQNEGLGMKSIENRCLSRNILPILSNKITVY